MTPMTPAKWKRVTKTSPFPGDLVWICVRFNRSEPRRGLLAYRDHEGDWKSVYPSPLLIEKKQVKVWTELVVPSQPPKRFHV